jgi:hypothetical protein
MFPGGRLKIAAMWSASLPTSEPCGGSTPDGRPKRARTRPVMLRSCSSTAIAKLCARSPWVPPILGSTTLERPAA